MEKWDLTPGDELTRAERRLRFGGAEYGGIEPSLTSGSIFVYTDPAVGAQHGYDYDGWVEKDTVFQYTGKGRKGDQTLTDRNRTLAEHEERELQIRVFAANGAVAGSSTKRQIYLGEFVVDKDTPFRQGRALDDNDDVRSVIVFRLLPVGDVLVRPQDRCNGASLSDTAGSDIQPGFKPKDDGEYVANIKAHIQTKTRKHETLVRQFGEAARASKFDVRTPHPIDLVLDREDFGLILVEAKVVRNGNAAEAVRGAIGQLFEYRHFLHRDSDLRLLALFSESVGEAYFGLLTELGIESAWPACSTWRSTLPALQSALTQPAE